MIIEVTKETFYTLFDGEPFRVDKKETYEINHYCNNELDQCGTKVWNYTSSKVHQYYLTDINA